MHDDNEEEDVIIKSQEERNLKRKLDWRILPACFACYFLAYLDRVNIGNAHEQLTEYLQLSEPQFSFAVSVFYIGYILFEIPSNLMLKRIPPGIWLGSLVFAFVL